MVIKSVKIDNFRNFKSLETAFSDQVNIFYGNNGSGKTNLLEAIFILCLGRSYRSATDTILVNEEEDVYRIEGLIRNDEKMLELAVAYQRGGRKKITLDKLPIKIAELYDNFSVVAVSPEDSDILSSSPSYRRQFIDIYLSQFSKGYIYLLSNYNKIMAQKNAALKNRMDPGAYNELLADVGSDIMKYRINFINHLKENAPATYRDISDGSEFDFIYKPSIKIEPDETDKNLIKERFDQQLYDYRAKEEIMERSLIGPHLDDIHFTINGYPARTHGSQGEWRTAALSLKLAVYHILKELREISPILLLDEIFAELDLNRSTRLIDSFSDFNQLFLTTAVEPPEFLKDMGHSFKIENGHIKSIS